MNNSFIVSEIFDLGTKLVVVALTIYPAILLNRRMRAKFPERQPFAWGYFLALGAVVIGAVNILYGLWYGGLTSNANDSAVALARGIPLSILGALLLRRNRWAWLLFTIILVGPGWIINGIYLKNRWSEMKGGITPTESPRNDTPARTLAFKSWWKNVRERISKERMLFTITVLMMPAIFAVTAGIIDSKFDHDNLTLALIVLFGAPLLAWRPLIKLNRWLLNGVGIPVSTDSLVGVERLSFVLGIAVSAVAMRRYWSWTNEDFYSSQRGLPLLCSPAVGALTFIATRLAVRTAFWVREGFQQSQP